MWRLTDEERELRQHIRTVVLEQIRPRVREMDENCDYPHDIGALHFDRIEQQLAAHHSDHRGDQHRSE